MEPRRLEQQNAKRAATSSCNKVRVSDQLRLSGSARAAARGWLPPRLAEPPGCTLAAIRAGRWCGVPERDTPAGNVPLGLTSSLASGPLACRGAEPDGPGPACLDVPPVSVGTSVGVG